MRIRVLKWLLKVSGIQQTMTNLIAENNNLKRRLRELEGIKKFGERF